MPRSIRAQVAPRVAPRVVDEVREVFLSSTAKDLKTYRLGVKEALERSKANVFLQESWAEPARDVLELCFQRLGDSDAYLGVFGYRYGWIPEGREKSITELECDHAFELWGASTVPPIFLFQPETGSEAARELERLANEILELEYPQEPDRRSESRQRQASLRQRLSTGRMVPTFRSLADLRELAATSVGNYNRDILRRASEKRTSPSGGIPFEDLGAIGRDEQILALKKARSALGPSSSPGMCVLVHGRESAGQLHFTRFLELWDGWDFDVGAPRMITLPDGSFDLAKLPITIANAVSQDHASARASMDELAGVILYECAKEPVVIMLGFFDSSEAIGDFQSLFWRPLLTTMRAKAANNRPPNSLTIVLTSLRPLPAPLPPYIRSGSIHARDVDYATLLPLPELVDLSTGDVNTWLETLGIAHRDVRESIANAVTREDGIPLKVFDRLNRNGFWARLT